MFVHESPWKCKCVCADGEGLCTAPNAAVQNQEKLVRLHCYLPSRFLVVKVL